MAGSPDFLDAIEQADLGADVLALLQDEQATEAVSFVHATATDPQAYNPFLGSITHADTTDTLRVIIGSRRDSAPVDVTVGRYRVLAAAADLSSDPDTSDTIVRASGEVLTVNAVQRDPVLEALGVWVLEVTTVER